MVETFVILSEIAPMALDWLVSPETPEAKAPNKLIFSLLYDVAGLAAVFCFHFGQKFSCHTYFFPYRFEACFDSLIPRTLSIPVTT